MMRILLTGGSSFTGLWIAQTLADAGHEVIAPLRREFSDYAGIRRARVRHLATRAELLPLHPMGSEALISLVASRTWDVLAHHGDDIPNYRSPDYDVAAGFARNVYGAESLISTIAERGARAVIVTGTTFEMGEGGDPHSIAVSPYGLSKGLITAAWRYYTRQRNLKFGKFVIAAPFGRWEEGRFVWSLMQSWFKGQPATVRTPAYIRDNLPVPLLGLAYAELVDRLLSGKVDEIAARPSGFVGTQADFARRVSVQMTSRLGIPCRVLEALQPSLAEPLHRTNIEPCIHGAWDQEDFWDDYASYYREIERGGLLFSRSA